MEHTDMNWVQLEGYKRATPDEKMQMMQSLLNTARSLKAAGVRMNNPHWTDQQVNDEVRRIFINAGKH